MSWPMVALGDIFEIARGGSPRPIDAYITDDPDGVNWISIRDASNSSKYITKTEKKILPTGVSKSRLVKPGDFLLTNSMSFGRPYILQTSGCIHDGWLVLSGDNEVVDQDYFYHLLGSDLIYRKFVSLAAGAVVKNLNSVLVRNVRVPLPPLPEQRRIAAILDKADALRAKRRAAIAKLDQLMHSVFLEMFGDPITNPKGWQLHNLAEATFFQEGPGILAKDFRDVGVPLVRLAGIDDGKVSLKGCNFVDQEMFERKWSQFALSEGDILVLTSATFGKPAVVGKETVGSIFYTGIIRFNPRHAALSAEFLKAFLASPWFLRQAQKLASGAVIKHFGPTHLKQMHIPIPTIELQLTFAQIAENIIRQKSVLRKSIKGMEKLFIGLQHRAFEGGV